MDAGKTTGGAEAGNMSDGADVWKMTGGTDAGKTPGVADARKMSGGVVPWTCARPAAARRGSAVRLSYKPYFFSQ
jgi:hypothetical protein